MQALLMNAKIGKLRRNVKGWGRTALNQGSWCLLVIDVPKRLDKLKEWWVEVEGLNALLLVHEKYGRHTDRYFKAFQLNWQFIKDYQIDPEFHGLYEMIGWDGSPTIYNKGRIWKAAYHDGRAFLNVSERLRHLAEKASQ